MGERGGWSGGMRQVVGKECVCRKSGRAKEQEMQGVQECKKMQKQDRQREYQNLEGVAWM